MPTPRARRPEPSQIGPLAIVALAALAVLILLAAGGHNRRHKGGRASAGATWLGLVGEGRPPVAVGERLIVVLRAPSLGDRVSHAGGRVDEATERRWTSESVAEQKKLLSRLALQGVQIQPEFTYTRVLNGFSAALDPRAVSLLERAPEVRGVYPVRAAYPAAEPGSHFERAMRSAAAASRPPGLVLPGYDGSGVTIALLDTGVDTLSPYLAGRIDSGIDLVNRGRTPTAEPNPGNPSEFERHGTEMAGVLVGHRGPFGLEGIAPRATVLPIRVAGWQHDAHGEWAVYGRTDQLIAGLEAAVDPNRDGDAHDAARIALVGVTEPYAAFASGPEARAVNGALKLDTLVVVPAGNDGPAGPAYGSISGPAGADGALAVGAADLRSGTSDVRVVLRVGLDVQMSHVFPLAGAVPPSSKLSLDVGAPRPPELSPEDKAAGTVPTPSLGDFFDGGLSLVAGRAALVRVGSSPGSSPGTAVENAARAGAYAVLLYGSGLPAGALGLDENVTIPVVAIPAREAGRILVEVRRGTAVMTTIGRARTGPNAGESRVAEFSSRGLAFDGRVKPDLVGPGVSVPTSEPGTHDDGTARFGTVNGTSVAAASVTGAGALLAQARPELSGADLKGLLIGAARPLAGDPLAAQGAGLVDVGAAAAAEVVAEPATLAFPPATPGHRVERALVVRNVSTRSLDFTVTGGSGGAKGLALSVAPGRLGLAPGQETRVRVRARVSTRDAVFAGAVRIAPEGGGAVRVPWMLAPAAKTRLVSGLCLTTGGSYTPQSGGCNQAKLPTFKPSDAAPAVLTLRAGRVISAHGTHEVRPVGRLEIGLRANDGRDLGLMVQLRDLLPGQYAFGLTGRGPSGELLKSGIYRVTLRAAPAGYGKATRASVKFKIRR